MKAWEIISIDQEWSVIVHADTRGKAVAKACNVENGEFIEFRTRRLPLIDDKPITRELMIASGWPEEYLEEPFDPTLWTFVCGCEHCK